MHVVRNRDVLSISFLFSCFTVWWSSLNGLASLDVAGYNLLVWSGFLFTVAEVGVVWCDWMGLHALSMWTVPSAVRPVLRCFSQGPFVRLPVRMVYGDWGRRLWALFIGRLGKSFFVFIFPMKVMNEKMQMITDASCAPRYGASSSWVSLLMCCMKCCVWTCVWVCSKPIQKRY